MGRWKIKHTHRKRTIGCLKDFLVCVCVCERERDRERERWNSDKRNWKYKQKSAKSIKSVYEEIGTQISLDTTRNIRDWIINE